MVTRPEALRNRDCLFFAQWKSLTLFGTVATSAGADSRSPIRYATLQKLRSRRDTSRLDSAAVLELCGPEPALPLLSGKIPTA
jgi:hypothetical protein